MNQEVSFKGISYIHTIGNLLSVMILFRLESPIYITEQYR